MANTSYKVVVAECPECETNIRFGRPLRLGQLVICPECETELEVSQLNPLKLYWALDDYVDDYENWD